MGSSRAWALLLLAAAAATTCAATQERVNEYELEAEEAAAMAAGDITADDVKAAWEAWHKLRNGAKPHTARKREARVPEESAAAAAADSKRVRVAEFTLSAESSFTAVSRALDRLANRWRARAGSRAPIAATEFVVEGSIDADTIQSYLRSHAARGSLAAAEANALRKVVGTLLQAPTQAPAAPGATARPAAPAEARDGVTTAPPRQRRLAKRAAPRILQSQVGQLHVTAAAATPSPSPAPFRGALSGRFGWALADDGFDAALPAEGIRRRMPPLYLAPIVPRVLRGDDDDDDDDEDDNDDDDSGNDDDSNDDGGGRNDSERPWAGDSDNLEDDELDGDDEYNEFIDVEDDEGPQLQGGGVANQGLAVQGGFGQYDEDESDDTAGAKPVFF